MKKISIIYVIPSMEFKKRIYDLYGLNYTKKKQVFKFLKKENWYISSISRIEIQYDTNEIKIIDGNEYNNFLLRKEKIINFIIKIILEIFSIYIGVSLGIKMSLK